MATFEFFRLFTEQQIKHFKKHGSVWFAQGTSYFSCAFSHDMERALKQYNKIFAREKIPSPDTVNGIPFDVKWLLQVYGSPERGERKANQDALLKRFRYLNPEKLYSFDVIDDSRSYVLGKILSCESESVVQHYALTKSERFNLIDELSEQTLRFKLLRINADAQRLLNQWHAFIAPHVSGKPYEITLPCQNVETAKRECLNYFGSTVFDIQEG